MLKYLFLIVLYSFTCFAFAEAQSKCLEFHVISNAPIGYESEKGEAQGVHWEYLTALEKSTGLCINKTLLPYARIWQSIEYGHHDGGIAFKSDARSNLVEYVALVRTVKIVVIPAKGVKISNYSDLQNIVIGKTLGTHLSKKFDSDKNLNVIDLSNYDQAARMLKHGRIDAIAGSALVLSYQLEKYDVLGEVDVENTLVLGEKEQWLQLSKASKHAGEMLVLKEGVEKLQKNGTFDLIMDKYYGQEWKQINK